ncbi:hypothetical protein CATMIT_01812, partial [Catenibacterium mitsuokai DSM 15897]
MLSPAEAQVETQTVFADAVVDRARPVHAVIQHSAGAETPFVFVAHLRHPVAAEVFLPVRPGLHGQALAEVALVAAPGQVVDAQAEVERAVAAGIEVGNVRAGAAGAAGEHVGQAVDQQVRAGVQALRAAEAERGAGVVVAVAQLLRGRGQRAAFARGPAQAQAQRVGVQAGAARLQRGLRRGRVPRGGALQHVAETPTGVEVITGAVAAGQPAVVAAID